MSENKINNGEPEISNEERLKLIGQRCLEIRENYNEEKILSQRKFAEELCITHSRISLIENGKTEMSLTELQAYQKAGKCSYDYLKGENECKNINNEEIHKRFGLSEKAIEVLEELNNEKNKKTENKRAFEKRIDTINCLLENESTYGILGCISIFLWDEYQGVFEVLEKNSGKTLHISASKLNNTFMLDIEKYLNKLKDFLGDERKKKSKKNKKRQ